MHLKTELGPIEKNATPSKTKLKTPQINPEGPSKPNHLVLSEGCSGSASF